MRIKRFNGTLLSTSVIASIISLAVTLLSYGSAHAVLTSHAPIHIEGNAGFTATNGVTSGSGTGNDPYIIENWNIDLANSAHGVDVRNTTAHFIIRNCVMEHGLGNYHGIYFDNAMNGVVYNNTVAQNSIGIYLNYSDNTLIENNIVENNNSQGIRLDSSDNNIISGNIDESIMLNSSINNCISGNTMENNNWGIDLSSSDNNIISGNTFVNDGLKVDHSYGNIVENNTVNGGPLVYLEGVKDSVVADARQVILVRCENITVENLNLSKATVGLELLETDNSKVINNIVDNNSYNGYGIWLDAADNNLISGNILGNNGWDPIYLDSSDNNLICGNTSHNNNGPIYLNYSSNNIISGNTEQNNSSGIYLNYSDNNLISGNVVRLGGNAISFQYSQNNFIENNTVENNYSFSNGINLYSSDNNLISGNTVENNGRGITLYSSDNDRIYHNNIINNNTSQSYDTSNNYWDNGYPSGGNYWSDYSGADNFKGENQNMLGSDGIGDVPYNISGGSNRDRYPLISSWPPTFKISLVAGWNLVGFKAVGAGNTPNSLFTGLTYATDYYIYFWNSPGGPYGLCPPDAVFKDNIGYWILIYHNKDISTNGTIPVGENIHLFLGWNLVHFPVVDNTTTPNKIFTGLTYATDYYVYLWNAPGGPYGLCPPNAAFKDNSGYWILIYQPWTVTVP